MQMKPKMVHLVLSHVKNTLRVCLVQEPTVTEWNGSIPEERVGSIPVFGRCKIVEWVGSIPVFGSEEWNEKWNNRNSKIRQIGRAHV